MLSFLSNLFSSAKEGKDLSYGLIRKYDVDALVRQLQWDSVEQLTNSLTSDELSRLLDGICLTNFYNRELKRYVSSVDNEFGYLVAGAWYLHMAWQARTRKLGNDLSRSEIKGFEDYLDLAEKHLNIRFESHAFQTEAQTRMVRVWMGMNEADRSIDSFGRSVAADETKFWAYHHLFKTLSPKWLGNKIVLKEFISSVQVPTMQYALWVMYTVEVFSDDYITNDQTAPESWYAENKEIVGHVLAYPPLPVNDSLISIYANNNLTYLYHLIGEQEKRNQLFDALGNRTTPYPWDYFGLEAVEAKKRFRNSAAYPRPC